MTIKLFEYPNYAQIFKKIEKPNSNNEIVMEKLARLVRKNFKRKNRININEPNLLLKHSIILKKHKVVSFLLDHFRLLTLDLNMKFEKEGGFIDIAYKKQNYKAIEALQQFGLRRSVFDKNEIESIQAEQELQKLELLKNCSDFYIEGENLEEIVNQNRETIKSENFSTFGSFLQDVEDQYTDDSDNVDFEFRHFHKLFIRKPDQFMEEFHLLDKNKKENFLNGKIKKETEWSGDRVEKLTPLQFACVKKNEKLAYYLISQGASVNDFTKTLDLTRICVNYRLIENINISRSSLHCAIDSGLSSLALFLLQNGAHDRVAICSNFYGNNVYSIPDHFKGSVHSGIIHLSGLHMAIIRGMHQVVKYMLEHDLSHLHNKTTGLYTPLHLAVRKKDLKMIKILFDYRGEALLNKRDRFGLTPVEILLYQEDDDFMEQFYLLMNDMNQQTGSGFLMKCMQWLFGEKI